MPHCLDPTRLLQRRRYVVSIQCRIEPISRSVSDYDAASDVEDAALAGGDAVSLWPMLRNDCRCRNVFIHCGVPIFVAAFFSGLCRIAESQCGIVVEESASSRSMPRWIRYLRRFPRLSPCLMDEEARGALISRRYVDLFRLRREC